MATGVASVLFATNRRPGGVSNGITSFGDTAQDAKDPGLICGAVEVDDIEILSPSHGIINKMSKLTSGKFDDGAMNALADSKNDVLVFVHGTANAFEDAVTRAAYNKLWLGQAKLPGTNYDVIVFTWPSRAYEYWNLVEDFVDYRHDQAQATDSAEQFGLFLDQVARVKEAIGQRKLNFLCHSMGNYMLAGAVEARMRRGADPAVPLFDNAVLAAADEVATTFTTPDNGRMATLRKLARKITVYFNYDDVLMAASHLANCDYRLGYDGPPNRADMKIFDQSTYSMVDCTGVDDYISSVFEQPDRSHQYYRQSPTVRFDIAQTLAGLAPKRPRYDARTNAYSLFAQPLGV